MTDALVEPSDRVALGVKRELARELHDQVAQTLTAMLVEIQGFKVEAPVDDRVAQELDSLVGSTREVLSNVRSLVSELRGEPDLETALVEKLRQGLVRRFRQQSGVEVRLSVAEGWPRRLPRQHALNVYRIIQEALNNAWLHGGARSVHVELEGRAGRLAVVTVADDGCGVTPEDLAAAGHGVLGMRERAWLLGGELKIERRRGRGTVVRCAFPQEGAAR